MIRAPDSFVYPAPFNIVEFFFIAPFEWVMPKRKYAKVSSSSSPSSPVVASWLLTDIACLYFQLNFWIMTTLFFVPLCIIAVYEAHIAPSKRFKDLFPENNPEVEGDDNIENPSSPDQVSPAVLLLSVRLPTTADPLCLNFAPTQEDGNRISTVSFKDLCKVFPDTTQGSQAAIVAEIVRYKLLAAHFHDSIR